MRRPTPARLILAASLLLASAIAAQDPSYTVIGSGCPGSAGTPTLTAVGGLPRVAETFTAQLTNVADIGFAVGITGLSSTTWGVLQLPADLTIVGMPGCLLFTDVRRQQALSINQGSADWELVLPVGSEWQGMTFYQQAFVLDDGVPGLGGVMSDAAEGVIGLSLSESPQVAVVFPPPCSTTENDYVVVRGMAADPDGIAEVLVNGQLALTSDGFANWQATIALAGGPNPVVVSATDLLGYRSEQTEFAVSTSKPPLGQVWSLDVDPDGHRLVVGGGSSIVSVDLYTGYRTMLAPSPSGACGMALTGNTVLVNTITTVTRIDLVTGNTALIVDLGNRIDDWFSEIATDGVKAFMASSDTGFTLGLVWEVGLGGEGLRILSDRNMPGASLEDVDDIAIRGTEALVISDWNSCSTPSGFLIAVDLITGNRRILSGGIAEPPEPQVGSGPYLTQPVGIALEGDRALVVDTCPPAILSIDLASGDRTIVSDSQAGLGPSLDGAWKIAAYNGRAFAAGPSLSGLIEIDLGSGNRTEFSPDGVGVGLQLSGPNSVIRVSDQFFVHDTDHDAVIRIDRMSGNRSIVSGVGTGTGSSFSGDGDIEWSGSKILLADRASNSIIAIDPVSGDRTLAAGAGIGTGPNFSAIGDIAMYGSSLLVRDGGLKALVEVDLATGNRSVISDDTIGSGPGLFGLDGLAVFDEEAFLAYSYALLAVDLASGNRRYVSVGSSEAYGPGFEFPIDIHVQESTVFVLDAAAGLFSVDMTSGNRRVVDGRVADGFHLANRVATMTSAADGSVLAVDLLSGDEVVVAK